jgi:hypothetical protein
MGSTDFWMEYALNLDIPIHLLLSTKHWITTEKVDIPCHPVDSH